MTKKFYVTLFLLTAFFAPQKTHAFPKELAPLMKQVAESKHVKTAQTIALQLATAYTAATIKNGIDAALKRVTAQPQPIAPGTSKASRHLKKETDRLALIENFNTVDAQTNLALNQAKSMILELEAALAKRALTT